MSGQGRKLTHVSEAPGDIAFREYVDRMREETGLTLDDLAEWMGVAGGTLRNWRRRAEMMSVYSFRKLIRKGMTPEEALRVLEVEE